MNANSHDITFFYPFSDELQGVDKLDLDEVKFWMEAGKTRRRGWVIRTYLSLKRKFSNVKISDKLPQSGVLVLLTEKQFITEFRKQFKSNPRQYKNVLIATVRADILHYRYYFGDMDIVQNDRFSDGNRTFFVPHWTQPGLIPRNHSRGDALQNIVFKGYIGSIDSCFNSPQWNEFLKDRNLNFEIYSNEDKGKIPNWHDYSQADLMIAVRPRYRKGDKRYDKPATKLVNSWIAGVPAIVGKEYAFQSLKRTSFDFIEVETLEQTMQVIDRLLEDKDLYLKMVDNGLQRAQEFTRDKITDIWYDILTNQSKKIYLSKSFKFSRKLPHRARYLFNFIHSYPSAYEIRKMIKDIYKKKFK